MLMELARRTLCTTIDGSSASCRTDHSLFGVPMRLNLTRHAMFDVRLSPYKWHFIRRSVAAENHRAGECRSSV